MDKAYEIGDVLGVVGLKDEATVRLLLDRVREQILATYRRDREQWGETIAFEWKVKARGAFSYE